MSSSRNRTSAWHLHPSTCKQYPCLTPPWPSAKTALASWWGSKRLSASLITSHSLRKCLDTKSRYRQPSVYASRYIARMAVILSKLWVWLNNHKPSLRRRKKLLRRFSRSFSLSSLKLWSCKLRPRLSSPRKRWNPLKLKLLRRPSKNPSVPPKFTRSPLCSSLQQIKTTTNTMQEQVQVQMQASLILNLLLVKSNGNSRCPLPLDLDLLPNPN